MVLTVWGSFIMEKMILRFWAVCLFYSSALLNFLLCPWFSIIWVFLSLFFNLYNIVIGKRIVLAFVCYLLQLPFLACCWEEVKSFGNSLEWLCVRAGILVRNTLVTYDRQNDRIGFWKTNCSELWKRLHMDTTTAIAPPLPSTVSNEGMGPALSPSGLEDHLMPGLTQNHLQQVPFSEI